MKKILIITLIIFSISHTINSQTLTPFNKNLHFRRASENSVLPHIDSLKIILVEFSSANTSAFKETIKNNPQITELQIKNPPFEAIQFISEFNYNKLKYLLIHDYKEANLKLPKFSNLEFL